MVTKLFTLFVCILLGSLHTQAQSAEYVSGDVPTQSERATNPNYHRIDTNWILFEDGEVRNTELLSELPVSRLKSQGIDMNQMKTLNPRDFYVVDDVGSQVFPRIQIVEFDRFDEQAYSVVMIPFVMSVQFAKKRDLFEQGTMNISGELRFTISDDLEQIELEKINIFDYSKPLERRSFEVGLLAKYDGQFASAILQILPKAFSKEETREQLRELLIALQIGDRPETIIETPHP